MVESISKHATKRVAMPVSRGRGTNAEEMGGSSQSSRPTPARRERDRETEMERERDRDRDRDSRSRTLPGSTGNGEMNRSGMQLGNEMMGARRTLEDHIDLNRRSVGGGAPNRTNTPPVDDAFDF